MTAPAGDTCSSALRTVSAARSTIPSTSTSSCRPGSSWARRRRPTTTRYAASSGRVERASTALERLEPARQRRHALALDRALREQNDAQGHQVHPEAARDGDLDRVLVPGEEVVQRTEHPVRHAWGDGRQQQRPPCWDEDD